MGAYLLVNLLISRYIMACLRDLHIQKSVCLPNSIAFIIALYLFLLVWYHNLLQWIDKRLLPIATDEIFHEKYLKCFTIW